MDRERKEKEAAEEAERSRKEKLDMMVDEIRKDLEKQMDCDGELQGTEMWVEYAKWCKDAFNTYGDNVYDHLATVENFQAFVRYNKSQDMNRVCIFESSRGS